MHATGTEDWTERLDRLERENLRLKRAGVALAVGTLALFVVGTDLVRPSKQVVAERFVVKDKAGKVRATLAMKEDGSPQLALYDSSGRSKVLLRGLPDNSASLDFYDRGEVHMSLASQSDGSAMLNLFDPRHGASSGFYIWPDGSTGLGLQEGRRGLALGVQADGSTKIAFSDARGRTLGGLGALRDESPRFLTRDSGRDAPLSIAPAALESLGPVKNPGPPCKSAVTTDSSRTTTSFLAPEYRPAGPRVQVPPWRETRACF